MDRQISPIQERLRSETVKRVAKNFLGMEHFSWIALAAAAAFFVGAGWIPDGITNLFLPDGARAQGFCQLFGAATILFALGWTINRQIEKAHKIEVQVTTPEPARVLVVFLSTIGRTEKALTIFDRLKKGENVTREEISGTSWEMPLIAIAHHQRRLQRLMVITSQRDGGSHDQYPAFEHLVLSVFPKGGFLVKELTSDNLDFEDIAGVHGLLDAWYDEINLQEFGKSNDIITDLTGGQKPASIAAAMVTLAEGRRFQYVSTTDKTVQLFDLIVSNK